MEREFLSRAEAIFQLAADLPPRDRAAFLAERCGGDPALRELVTRLLVHHDDGMGSFLEPHPAALGALMEAGAEVRGPESGTGTDSDPGTTGDDDVPDDHLRRVVEVRRELLGAEAPRTLEAMNDLARAHRKGGRHGEAEALYRETLEIRRRILGPDHPETLRTMLGLAASCWWQARHEEAEALYREVLEIERRVLGEEHPSTLVARSNLALVCSGRGRHAEAEALEREALGISRRVLGERHARTNGFRYDLACALALQGRREEALSSLREALDHGYRGPVSVSIRDDPDLASLRGDPELDAIADELERRGAEGDAPG